MPKTNAQFEALMAERFPDAERRAERRAALHIRLDEYLDNFHESDGGWAPCSWEDLHTFQDICREVRDLKFARDPDGDSVIDMHMVPRTEGRQLSMFLPYDPWIKANKGIEMTEDDMLKSARDLAQSHRQILGWADDVSRSIENIAGEIIRDREYKVKFEAEMSALLAAIAETPEPKDAMILIKAFLKGRRLDDENMTKIGTAYRTAHEPTFGPIWERVNRLIDDGDMTSARIVIRDAQAMYAGLSMTPVRARFNEFDYKRRKALADEQGVPLRMIGSSLSISPTEGEERDRP